MFIRDPNTRNLLKKYADVGKHHQYNAIVRPMKDSEYTKLCDLLATNSSLQDIVRSAKNPCPQSLRKLAGELSMPTPTCGMLQIAGNEEVISILVAMGNGDGLNFKRSVLTHKYLLAKSCPLLMEFLEAEDIDTLKKISLLNDLLASIKAPFRGRVELNDEYYRTTDDSDENLAFYPNHPIIRGDADYEADKNNKSPSECRKNPNTHSTLNPGVFTAFCPHGVAIGLQLMFKAESPHIPFKMFMQRFKEMPSDVVYDNSCNLHLYCLRREPNKFQKTRFMVDRFHYPNHVGCSLGYKMDSYSADEDIVHLNSQVCEQANRDLRRLSTSATFMTPENLMQHVKVFLAIRNILKIIKC